MGATGQDMGRGKESERRKGEREKMGYSPKLQFLAPPLHIGGHSVPMGEKKRGEITPPPTLLLVCGPLHCRN